MGNGHIWQKYKRVNGGSIVLEDDSPFHILAHLIGLSLQLEGLHLIGRQGLAVQGHMKEQGNYYHGVIIILKDWIKEIHVINMSMSCLESWAKVGFFWLL